MASMSILKYMRSLKEKPDFPDPTGPLSEKAHSKAIPVANVKVIEGLEEVCQSCGSYVCIPDTSPELRI